MSVLHLSSEQTRLYLRTHVYFIQIHKVVDLVREDLSMFIPHELNPQAVHELVTISL